MPSQLQNVVQGDLVSIKATVIGSYEYETTMGGQMTVPQLHVDKITVTGHTNS